jgi:HAD superfamily hydrolase (TIGR01509 family)
VSESIALPRALLFDMDGTLTEPYFDFPRIRAEIGIGDRPLLETIAQMPPAERAVAEAILHHHEHRAATESTLNAGCNELIALAVARSLKTALITRNTRKSANCVLEKHDLSFDVLITREDANGKYKPDPAPLWLACEKLGVEPPHAWMVGDSYHDVDAGIAAGIKTVWISYGQPRAFANEPWRTVHNLHELIVLLSNCGDGSRARGEGV